MEGLIYKLTTRDENNTKYIYIGSCKDLSERIKEHKKRYKTYLKKILNGDIKFSYYHAFKIFDISQHDFKIKIIKSYENITTQNLRIKENFYINKYKENILYKVVNKYQAFENPNERRLKNKLNMRAKRADPIFKEIEITRRRELKK